MMIPFLNLTPDSDKLKKEINDAFALVMQRGSFILGEEVRAFEMEWARFCEARGAVGLANGTDAITLALTASGVIRPDAANEIITTPLSAAYTALAIRNAGAVPVFVDIDERTFTIDPTKIEAAITPFTRAIIPVHLYGQMADMKAISEIAARYNLIIIEDAAQAHGAKSGGKPCGALSLGAAFSFYPTKNLGGFGDGGAVISNHQDFLHKVSVLRQGGHFEALQTETAGRNSRLDEMQAAFLRVKLKKLKESNDRRCELAQIYFKRLKHIPQLRLPMVNDENNHVFHLFVVRHSRRDELRQFLFDHGIETLIHYPYLLHQQILFKPYKQQTLPIAERVVTEIISLPLYPQMKNEEIETVCQKIVEFGE